MSQEMHGFSVQLDDLASFRNGVVDFKKNYELIVDQLSEADLLQTEGNQWRLLGFTPGNNPHSGKAAEFASSCEAFVTKYAELMSMLLRINTAVKDALGSAATNLTATHESYAELDLQKASTFQGFLGAGTPEGGVG